MKKLTILAAVLLTGLTLGGCNVQDLMDNFSLTVNGQEVFPQNNGDDE